tara:strand:- start:37 stop:309 length:273 start_codon:yes stop_codon:yes gene_type:complete
MRQKLRYDDYLTRFDTLVGSVQVGQIAEFKGKLVKKLNAENFGEITGRYEKLISRFEAMVANRQTIEEGVMMQIRMTETELLIEQSAILP